MWSNNNSIVNSKCVLWSTTNSEIQSKNPMLFNNSSSQSQCEMCNDESSKQT